jgi:hypothetical protein
MNQKLDDFDKLRKTINEQTVDLAALRAENERMRGALEKFTQLGMEDGNEACEKAKKLLLYRCPEFIGYLKSASALLGGEG